MGGYRVITWSKRDGITGVTDEMSLEDACELARTLVEANPSWLNVDVERIDADATIATFLAGEVLS